MAAGREASTAAVDDPNRRSDIEAWLDKHGVTWEYAGEVELSKTDFDKSLRNQARVYTTLDPEVVTTYAEAINRGDQFPAIVAHRSSKTAKLVNVDGNHRWAAFKEAGRTTAPTYLITKARPQTVVMMTFEANTKHGMPTSHAERLHQAVWLMHNGATYAQASAAVNVKEGEVKRAWARQQADSRADEVGILRTTWDAISQSSKNRLLNVLTDEGFRAAVDLTFRANLGAEDVFDLVAELNKVKSSARQEAIVKQWAAAHSEQIQEAGAGIATGGRRQRTPKQAFGIALASLATLPENLDVIAEKYVGDERSETAKRAREAATRLTSIADRLEQGA